MIAKPPAPELTPSDAELLGRIARRDAAALGEIYDRRAGMLFSLCVHILGDRREAEEVLQDVFVQVWKRAETFDAGLGSALSWVMGITRNRCIDCLRSRQRRARLLDEVALALEAGAAGAADPAHARMAGSDELAAVRRAVESLPLEQNQAIAMAFFGGMTHQEIAAALREPLGTIKARIRRGMLKLRELLEAGL